MGKVTVITPEQQLVLNEFKKDTFLTSQFYFSGGTALSLYYLQHRESIDIDFFSEERFEPQTLLAKITSWEERLNVTTEYLAKEDTHIFNLIFAQKQKIKVDFSFYPYRRVEKGLVKDGITVDSLLDIAINKLLTVEQRAEAKDFVDLYFLLQKFTVWDLLEGVRVKFKVIIEPFIIGSDFLKVELFDFLPIMIKPLTLDELKTFFRQKAKELGRKVVE